MITQQQYAQPQNAVTPQQGAQQQYGSLPQQPSQPVSQPSNYTTPQPAPMNTAPTQPAYTQQQYVNNAQPAGQNPAQMQPYNQPYQNIPQQNQLSQQQYQQPMQQAPQQYQQQDMPQQPQYSGQAPAQGQYSQPQGQPQAPQKYRPPVMEGARRAGGGQISKFVKWDNASVGTQYFGTFLKFIKSQYGNWNAVIEDDAGQEILLGTPGKLRYLLHSENIIPGKYICVTYLGKEQMKKNRLNVPQKDAHDFTLDIFDERDKSSDPRFFNEIEKVRAYYELLGNNQVQQAQAQAQPVAYGATSYGQTPYGQAPTQYQQPVQPVQQQYAPQQYAQQQYAPQQYAQQPVYPQQAPVQPMTQPQQPGYAPQQFNTGDIPF
jgi:hypothetical protein